jgi:hypothetical protein
VRPLSSTVDFAKATQIFQGPDARVYLSVGDQLYVVRATAAAAVVEGQVGAAAALGLGSAAAVVMGFAYVETAAPALRGIVASVYANGRSCIVYLDLSAPGAYPPPFLVAGNCSADGGGGSGSNTGRDGLGEAARLGLVQQLTAETWGASPTVYFGDRSQHCYRRGDVVWNASEPITTLRLNVSRVAGQCGYPGSADGNALTTASFLLPTAAAVTKDGTTLFTGTVFADGHFRAGGDASNIRIVSSLQNAAARTVSTLPVSGVAGPVWRVALHPAHQSDDDFMLYVSSMYKNFTPFWRVAGSTTVAVATPVVV